MKRCPECRRDYYDDSLLYCLDDGNVLLEGPASGDEPATAVLLPTGIRDGAPTQNYEQSGFVEDLRRNSIRPRTLLIIAAASSLLLAAGILGFRYIQISPGKQISSVAVMPFVNETGDPNLEYLSDGMTEMLLNRLSQLPGINVKARSLVFRYKGRSVDIQELGSELGVQAILSGRIIQQGDSLTLFLELVETESGNRIWGEQYHRKNKDIVQLQGDIARDVSEKLQAKLSGIDEQRLSKKHTSDSEAYQLYLKGRYQLNKRTEESLRSGIVLFQQAIEQDPNYGLAYAGLADAYNQLGFWTILRPTESFPKAKAAAVKALEIDSDLVEAHTALAFATLVYDWDFAKAESEYQRALGLNPRYVAAREQYGYLIYLSDRRRFEEAMRELKMARDLDPLALSVQFNIAALYYFEGQYDIALQEVKRLQESDPGFTLGWGLLGAIYREERKYDQMVDAWLKGAALEGAPLSQEQVDLLKAIYKSAGVKAYWTKRAEILQEVSKQRHVSPIFIAMEYAPAGEKELAFQWLEKAHVERSSWLVELRADPVWTSLREEPRFQELLKKIGFPEEIR